MTSCRASNHFKFDFNPSRRNESALIKDAECIETTLKSTHNTHQKVGVVNPRESLFLLNLYQKGMR